MKPGYVGPLLLLTIGFILLFNNIGLLPWEIWGSLWQYWPVIRAHESNVSLMLKASELILLTAGIMNLNRKKIDLKTRSPVSMENIALYIPV